MMIIGMILALGAAPEQSAAERDKIIVVGGHVRENRGIGDAESVASLDPDQIADLSIAGLADVTTVVPSLVALPAGVMAVEQYAIRGLHSPVGAPTVGLYLDDVPLSVRPSAFLGAPDVQALDLAGVEVLRGAQGAASGASALAGIVRLKARRPDFDREDASASAEFRATEAGAPGFQTTFAMGRPLARSVAVRAAVSVGRDGGYIDRVGNDPQTDVDSIVTAAARVAVEVRSEGWLILPSVTVQHRKIADLSIAEGPGSLQAAFVRRQPGRDDLLAASIRTEGTIGAAAIVATVASLNRQTRQAVDYSPVFGELILVGTIPGVLVPGGSLSTIRAHQRNLTGEVRASSGKKDAGWTWTMGVQVSRSDLRLAQNVTEPGIAELTRTVLKASVEEVFGTPLLDGIDSYRSAERDRETTFAGFATGSWSPTGRFLATAGFRVARYGVAILSRDAGPYAGTGDAVPQKSTRAATRLLPRASLAWRPWQGHEAALSWTRGYRPGGGNVPISASLCAGDLAARGRTKAPLGYRGDDTETLDLGYRGETTHAAVSVNGFATRWRGLAQQVDLPGCGFAYVDNVGRARVHGVEADARLKAARGLTMNAGIGYVDARFTRTINDAMRGARLPYVPRWSVLLTGNWEQRLPSGAQLSIGLAHRHAGDFRRTIATPRDTARITRGPAAGRLDAWVRVSHAALTLEFFVRNLANARPDLYASVDLVPVTQSPVRTATIRPRTWGLTMIWRRWP